MASSALSDCTSSGSTSSAKTNPSSSSSSLTNTPKLVTLTTRPSTIVPRGYFLTISGHGFSLSCFKPMRTSLFVLSMPKTLNS